MARSFFFFIEIGRVQICHGLALTLKAVDDVINPSEVAWLKATMEVEVVQVFSSCLSDFLLLKY